MTDKLYRPVEWEEGWTIRDDFLCAWPGGDDPQVYLLRDEQAEAYARLGRAYMALVPYGDVWNSFFWRRAKPWGDPPSTAAERHEMAEAVKALEDKDA